MAPGGRDKKLCDCLASTLRKGGGEEGEREEMGSDVRILHLKA